MCKKMELLGLQMYCSDIHKMEHGTKTIRDFELKAFSIALGISLDQLFEDTNKEQKPGILPVRKSGACPKRIQGYSVSAFSGPCDCILHQSCMY